MIFRHGSLTRRDAILLLIGASSMHIWSILFAPQLSSDQSVGVVDTPFHDDSLDLQQVVTTTAILRKTTTQVKMQTATATVTSVATATALPASHAIFPYDELPSTEVLAHAPGWTLFRNLYMSNGTMFIVADEKQRQKLPETRMMLSTPLEAWNTPENIALREPTEWIMNVITPEQAEARWGMSDKKEKTINRVWTVEGNTVLVNEPKQFLRHYYHLVAELIFGVQAFWHGAFSQPLPTSSSQHYSLNHAPVPSIDRLIFAYSNADGWRDDPGFNRYFLRAVMPSLTVEHEEDWQDRVKATYAPPGSGADLQRAWHFPMLLLTDRSASHRGPLCGSQNQRIASEAWDLMRVKGKLRGIHVGGWWAPMREAMWRFAGAEEGLKKISSSMKIEQSNTQAPSTEVVGIDTPTPKDPSDIVNVDVSHQKLLALPEKIVISYISRQTARNRKLTTEDHEGLVQAIKELVHRKNKERKKALDAMDGIVSTDDEETKKRDIGEEYKNRIPLEWEFNELIAEKMTKDEQIKAAARTTIMLGVHGNGLTHLVFMKPTRYSTVIELFYPGGFAHDYQWTTRALGMTHYAVWNDTHHVWPAKPDVAYPDGFQKNAIPVHGPHVAQIIEDRVAGMV